MTSLSLTNKLRLYSNSQFESLFTKITLVIFNSLTIVMVFFSGHTTKFHIDEKKRNYVVAAAIFAVIHSSTTMVYGSLFLRTTIAFGILLTLSNLYQHERIKTNTRQVLLDSTRNLTKFISTAIILMRHQPDRH